MHLIQRSRILSLVAESTRRVLLIEAAGGYGKSTLLDDLAANEKDPYLLIRSPLSDRDLSTFLRELASAARMAQCASVLAALDDDSATPAVVAGALGKDGATLLLDDLDLWDGPVAQLMSSVVRQQERSARFAFAFRLCPEQLNWLANDPRSMTLRSDVLAFSESETAELLAVVDITDDALVATSHRVTHGWPLATGLLVDRLAGDRRSLTKTLRSLSRINSLADDVLRAYLHAMTSDDRRTTRLLALLPMFDYVLADQLGGAGCARRITAAGLPYDQRPDGWLELPEHVRHYLVRSETPDRTKLPVAIDYLVNAGEAHAAIHACLAAGERTLAAHVIADLTPDQENFLDLDTLRAALIQIGDVASAAPRCLFVFAHISAVRQNDAEGLAYLRRAVDLFAVSDPELRNVGHVEALCTLAIWFTYDGNFGDARQILDRCAEHVDLRVRNASSAHLREARGVFHHGLSSDEDLERATLELTEALAIWRELDDVASATTTTFRLGAGVLVSRGLRHEAIAVLDSLSGMSPLSLANEANLETQRALLLPYLGDTEELAITLANVRRIAGLLEDRWIFAQSIVAEVLEASFAYDAERVDRLASEAISGGHFTFEDMSEGLLWCDVAEAYARTGLHAAAALAMATARATTGVPEWHLVYYEASLAARSGDPDQAQELLDVLLLREDLERDKRWSAHLLRAYVAHRTVRTDDARKHLEQAQHHANELFQPQLLEIVERRLVEEIRSGLEDDAVTLRVTTDIGTHVALFDRFCVTVEGEDLAVPRGHGSNLIKILALSDGRLVVDQVIDRLWPDALLEVGRRRLRNVLSRLREACGELIVRDGEALALSSSVSTDYELAQAAAAEALSTRGHQSVARALLALDRNLLPDNIYADWADDARTAQHRMLVRLYQASASLAEQNGDTDAAVDALKRCYELDPTDTRPLRAAIRLLEGVGKQRAAAALRVQL